MLRRTLLLATVAALVTTAIALASVSGSVTGYGTKTAHTKITYSLPVDAIHFQLMQFGAAKLGSPEDNYYYHLHFTKATVDHGFTCQIDHNVAYCTLPQGSAPLPAHTPVHGRLRVSSKLKLKIGMIIDGESSTGFASGSKHFHIGR